MVIGFIGFGEVGYEISKGLVLEGCKDVYAFDPLQDVSDKKDYIVKRAIEANVRLAESALKLVEKSDFIIAAVPGTFALAACKNILPALKKGQIYADISTSSPIVKREMAEIVEKTGATFVDGGLMASLAQTHHKVPVLLAGSGADDFARALTPFGMKLTKISNKAGDAIAVKLVRSIYMKGIASLGAEMLEAAYRLQVQDLVLPSIAETMDAKPFLENNNFLVIASAWHGDRQVHEMEDVAKMLDDIGVKSTMTDATKERLAWLASLKAREVFANKRPEHWEKLAEVWGN